jgi:hypothetical protein
MGVVNAPIYNQSAGGIYMTNNTSHSVSGSSSELDYLTLWLNYENKLDELRGRFVTIAGLLFTVQAGVFVLMLDKIFDVDDLSWRLILADTIIVVISILTCILLHIVANHFSIHLDINYQRSVLTVKESEKTSPNIKDFIKRINEGLKLPNYIPRDHKYIIEQVKCIYIKLFGFTIAILVVHIIILLIWPLIIRTQPFLW